MVGLSWDTLDPASPTYSAKLAPLMSAIYGSLFTQVEDGTVEPGIAEGYEFSKDGLTLRLTLRSDVKFSDGTPLDAEAVKFNYDRILGPDGSGVTALPDVESVSTEGEDTVVLHMSKPNYSIVVYLAGSGGAAFIASPAAIEDAGDQYGTQPVGAGPFKLVEQAVGAEAELERNDDYHEGKPYLDGLTFTNVSSPQQAYNGVKTGAFNFYYQADPNSISQAQSDSSLTVLDPPDTGFFYIVFNATSAPFDQLDARKAVASSVDQAAISKAIFYDQNVPTQSVLTPGTWASPGETVEGYPAFDLEAAKKLAPGLEFTLTYGSQNAQLAKAIENQMNKAGIDVTLETLDQAQLFERYGQRNYEAVLYSFGFNPDPSTAIEKAVSSAGSFSSGLDSPAIEDLVDQGVEVETNEERKELYGKLAIEMAKELPLALLGSSPLAHVATNTLQDVTHTNLSCDFAKAWLSQ